jgi:hypothetical protein
MFADPFRTRQGNDGCVLDAVFGSPGGRADTQRGVRPDVPGTLKKIDETEAVQIGYRDNSPPFAFLDANKKPIGYSLDSRSLSTKSPQKRASLRFSPSLHRTSSQERRPWERCRTTTRAKPRNGSTR